MAVTIDLELRAESVADDVLAIATALETLDSAADDLDLGELDIDDNKITGSISRVMDDLNELQDKVSEVNEEIAQMEDMELEMDHNINVPDGETNDGDSSGSDPPNKMSFPAIIESVGKDASPTIPDSEDDGLSPAQLEKKIGDHLGFDKERINVPRSIDDAKLKEISSNLEHITQDLTMKEGPYSHLKGEGDRSNLADESILKNFFSEQQNWEEMPWNEIQNKASKAGVYEQDDSKEDLIRKLRNKQFDNPLITYGKEDGGLMGLGKAVQAKQSPGDMDFGRFNNRMDSAMAGPDWEPDKTANRKARQRARQVALRMADLRNQQRQALEDVGLDPDRVRPSESGSDYDVTKGDRRKKLFSNIGGWDYDDFHKKDREFWMKEGEISQSLREKMGSGLPGYDDPDKDWSLDDSSGILSPLRNASRGKKPEDIIDDSNFLSKIENIDKKRNIFSELTPGTEKLGKALGKMFPSMSMVMNLIAGMIPVVIALGVQLLGVASAMGAVALAGAAIMGLGLIGGGDDMASSLSNAKQEASDLAENLFKAVQPSAKIFAPIQARMFSAIPGRVREIAEAMEGLTKFEGTLFQLGAMFTEGLTSGLKAIEDNSRAISQLTLRFAKLVGTGIKDLFAFLFQEASNGQSMLVSLGKDMKRLAKVIYRASFAIGKILSTFSHMVTVLVIISQLLEYDIIALIVSLVGWMWALGQAKVAIVALANAFKGLIVYVAKGILSMTAFMWSVYGTVAAVMTLVGAIGLLTAGLSVGLGAMSMEMVDTPGSMPSGGAGDGIGAGSENGGMVYNDNRNINIDNSGSSDYGENRRVYAKIDQHSSREEAQALPEIDSDD